MSDSEDESASRPEYKVGYGKPPLGTRFKKGRSGNPRGRPRKPDTLQAIMLEEVTSKVPIRENGRTKRVTPTHAMIKQLKAAGLSGDAKARRDWLKMQGELERSLPEPKPPEGPDERTQAVIDVSCAPMRLVTFMWRLGLFAGYGSLQLHPEILEWAYERQPELRSEHERLTSDLKIRPATYLELFAPFFEPDSSSD